MLPSGALASAQRCLARLSVMKKMRLFLGFLPGNADQSSSGLANGNDGRRRKSKQKVFDFQGCLIFSLSLVVENMFSFCELFLSANENTFDPPLPNFCLFLFCFKN